jgi:hypothetical protein
MDSTEIRAIYLFSVLILAFPISLVAGSKWAAKYPDKLPFKWGYFQSLCSILGIVMGTLAVIGLSEHEQDGELQFLCVFGIAHGLTGIFMFRRNRWWWIIGILITLNPILWIANGVYLSNRWKEMRSQARDKSRKNNGNLVLPSLLFLRQQKNESGPFHRDQVTAKWNSSEITADTLFRENDEDEWKPLLPYFDSSASPWVFGRAAKCIIFGMLGLITLWIGAGIASEAYNRWERERSNQPQVQNSFHGFSLGQNSEDVLFHHGEPYERDQQVGVQNRWLFQTDDYTIMLQYKDDRVQTIAYASESGYNHPDLLGFTKGSGHEDILAKLGNPSFESKSKDGLSRIFYYDEWNAFFVLTKAEVEIYGIYDSTISRPVFGQ